MNKYCDVIGLIPAAGYAKRISSLACSKEVYPISISETKSRVVSSYLLESFRLAGIENTFIILRNGKWDIPEKHKNGETLGLNIAYLITDPTEGVPHTIDKAFSFTKNNKILFGFPDIIFKPINAFSHLLEKQAATKADIVLGLFPAANPQKMDMIKFDDTGKIENLVIKPEYTNLIFTWIIAVWNSKFTNFINTYLNTAVNHQHLNDDKNQNSNELYLGHIIIEAINSGFKIEHIKFRDGLYIDIGTPSELNKVDKVDWIKELFYNDQNKF